ncbi:hypothetical protein VCR1J2_190082 [Vibrio coralliirubri]|nr:hypothetical protein VCR1J2_190082 [Vibrio coralliirubri]CDU08885.1 hypothetical protein VCR8J2_50099 [Vibrio coralliirubri]
MLQPRRGFRRLFACIQQTPPYRSSPKRSLLAGLVGNQVRLGAKLRVLAACIVASWSLLSMTRAQQLVKCAFDLRSGACSI